VTRVGVLGTGVVGRTLAGRLAEVGHDVVVGSRTAKDDGTRTFADAAAHGEVVVNATAGLASIDALTQAGAENLAAKPVLDVANALDSSEGFPPIVRATDRESLAERIQAAFPQARVVKSLNTMNADVMANPRKLAGPHTVFVAGDDADAKHAVTALLLDLGWTDDEVLDLGGLSAARGVELYLTLWLSVRVALGSNAFNVLIVRE
jgi:8-hydroxy-5-deazaflavin:NADPH oxidoreductase